MIDTILYVADFPTLVSHLDANHPEMLERNEDGSMVNPPVVTGFARTPATTNGNALLVYARLYPQEELQWRGMPHVEILAEAPYEGSKTPDTVYGKLWADSVAAGKYDAVYDRSPKTTTGPDGETYTTTPPERFGIMG